MEIAGTDVDDISSVCRVTNNFITQLPTCENISFGQRLPIHVQFLYDRLQYIQDKSRSATDVHLGAGNRRSLVAYILIP